ncbi:hypothetical protein NQ015_10600 [Corynebacterium sp. 153RC1]|uniref:hypothetical protein n=1 Tax=unclassified Corynebacterium TaxID=2624378 RepID=UPI00211CAF5D|nr:MULTISPECIES: hypothetical protein [unclassified Corynebacterium]MCQ9371575.1 hypothetical protein [Corynebacterium sp. 35RC1]MCQ9353011.1 hypothetical protein [Corynebacterium sp. 209RC1]MCQ9355672.1 hypothetical protein [Corynebacterium sp. 1222RC1]MCQ9357156.1 hypothetical protein [Corynebacterium sp. 122RC1]MCQ9359700.1 hypothetical protein [Corynebacterium sp. 142RC1]
MKLRAALGLGANRPTPPSPPTPPLPPNATAANAGVAVGPLQQVRSAIEAGANNAVDIAATTGLRTTLVQAILHHLQRGAGLELLSVSSGLAACAGCAGCGSQLGKGCAAS